MSSSQLKHFASLWTLLHYPDGSERNEWSYDQKLASIKAAGFDGFQWFALRELSGLSVKHGLAFLGGCAADKTNYAERLKEFVPFNPVRVNIQLGNDAIEPIEAARLWITMNEMADDLGLVLDLETHRGTCTETPEKTWRIAEIYQQHTSKPIRLTFDFSHFATVKHLLPPYAGRLLAKPELLRESRQMHLRPFNGHHCQIAATNSSGKMAEWAKPWFEFVEATFFCWLQEKSNDDGTLWVCPEFGGMTSGYWLPSFRDPWLDAMFAQKEVERLWRQLQGSVKSFE